MNSTGIIFFGDSVLAGTGASDRSLSCAKLIKDRVNLPVLLKGRNWHTSLDGLCRLEQDVLKQSAFSHVVILFGNNDSWLVSPSESRVPLAQFSNNLVTIADRIAQNRQMPYLCTLQLISPQKILSKYAALFNFSIKENSFKDILELHDQYNDEIYKIAKRHRIECIDLRAALQTEQANTIADDGLHPNDNGHKIIAATILSYLKRL